MQGSSGDGGAAAAAPAGAERSGAVRHVGPGGTKPEWDWTTWSPAGVGALGARSGPSPKGSFSGSLTKSTQDCPRGVREGGGRPPGGPRGGPGGPGGPPGLGTHLGLGSCLHRHQRKRRGRQTKRRGRQRQRRGRRRWPGSTAGRRWRPSSPPTGVPSTEKSRRSIPSPHTPGYGGNPGWF